MRITSSKWKQSLETTSQDLQEPAFQIEPQHEKEEALTTYFFYVTYKKNLFGEVGQGLSCTIFVPLKRLS